MSRLLLTVVALLSLPAHAAPTDGARAQAACAKGQAAACQRWIALYDKGAVPSADEARARDRFVAACEAGRHAPCIAAARIYEIGARRDLGRAEKLAAHACDGGDADGCATLGQLLFDNDAGHPAPALAAFQKACTGNKAHACSMAALLLSEGLGAVANPKVAADLAAKACHLGDQPGCTMAADLR